MNEGREVEVDPRELLRKIMLISPEDAEDACRDSSAMPARTRRKSQGSSRGAPSGDRGADS